MDKDNAKSKEPPDDAPSLTPYTLDEALAVFRIAESVDEPTQQESWLDEAVKDSFRGSSLV